MKPSSIRTPQDLARYVGRLSALLQRGPGTFNGGQVTTAATRAVAVVLTPAEVTEEEMEAAWVEFAAQLAPSPAAAAAAGAAPPAAEPGAPAQVQAAPEATASAQELIDATEVLRRRRENIAQAAFMPAQGPAPLDAEGGNWNGGGAGAGGAAQDPCCSTAQDGEIAEVRPPCDITLSQCVLIEEWANPHPVISTSPRARVCLSAQLAEFGGGIKRHHYLLLLPSSPQAAGRAAVASGSGTFTAAATTDDAAGAHEERDAQGLKRFRSISMMDEGFEGGGPRARQSGSS